MIESTGSELEDRISELPDSLIIYIFEFLPITDVVRTTILSSRWRNLWTTAPCLILDSIHSIDKHRYFVNGVLENWRGIKVSKFMVNLFTNEASFSYFDSWVRFAVDNGVEVLYLRVTSPLNEHEIYMVPQYLYSCSSLKQLPIDGCTIRVQGSVQWNQLKSLRIDCFEISGNDVNHILSGCRQLEVFIFSVFDNVVNLSICSSSLKMLSVKKTIFYHEIEVTGSELRIGTPNLETLQIIGTPHGNCSLMDVSSLTHASLGFYCTSTCNDDESCPWEDLIRKGLSQILPAIQHVEKITLSDCCIKALGASIGTYVLPPFPNIKIVCLQGYLKEYQQILSLLEIFPKLKTLVLESEKENELICANHAKVRRVLETDLQNSILLQLRTVKFYLQKVQTSFLPLIEFPLSALWGIYLLLFISLKCYLRFHCLNNGMHYSAEALFGLS